MKKSPIPQYRKPPCPPQQGNLRAELHFKEPLANTVNLIVYAEFQSVIEIDGNRNVLFDYTNYKWAVFN